MLNPKKIRVRLGLSQSQFAIVVGVSRRTIQRWEAGDRPSKHGLRQLMSRAWTLQVRLEQELPRPENMEAWLTTAHPHLFGYSPLEMFAMGQWAAVSLAVNLYTRPMLRTQTC